MTEKRDSKRWTTSDELNFLEHIESWGIQKGNPIDLLEKYIRLGSRNWDMINKGKAMAYAQKRLDKLRLRA